MIDCTDEQLIEEVRRRGFVIRDAQIGREWVRLTDKDKDELVESLPDFYSVEDVIASVAAKLKEKNGG